MDLSLILRIFDLYYCYYCEKSLNLVVTLAVLEVKNAAFILWRLYK